LTGKAWPGASFTRTVTLFPTATVPCTSVTVVFHRGQSPTLVKRLHTFSGVARIVVLAAKRFMPTP